MMRYFDEVTALVDDGEPYTIPAHLSWSSSVDPSEANSPWDVVQRLRMVFPTDYTLTSGHTITWRGKDWFLPEGEQLHTRRGKDHHKSATLQRAQV